MDPFALELYFAKHEFTAKHLLCCSDTESWSMTELLSLADEECFKLWGGLRLGYTEASGHPGLREEIASLFYRPIPASHVRTFAGAEEAIYAFFRATIAQGDEVIVFTPAYQSLLSIPKACGANVIALDLEQLGGAWRFPLAKLKEVLSTKTRLVVLNTPHNPTGAMLTPAEQMEVIDLCRKHGVLLLADEVYREQELNGCPPLPPAATLYENAFSLGVMSKALGLAGLRIGWLCSQNTELLDAVSAYKHYLSICNSAPSEILALIALRNKDALLSRNKKITQDNLVVIQDFLARHEGKFEWSAPKGGCVGFMRFAGDGGTTLEALSDRLVNEFGVLLLPGTNFPGAQGDFSSYFRFGFGRKNFPEALAALEVALSTVL